MLGKLSLVSLLLATALLLAAGDAAVALPSATTRSSVSSSGTEGNGWSRSAAISADGRYVAFTSSATNLVPGDTNGVWDVFVHDRQTGGTERVSVGNAGAQANGASCPEELDAGQLCVGVSAEGRYVVFGSYASNLAPGDADGNWDIFVRDRQTGATDLVSVDSDGIQGLCGSNLCSMHPAISGDGRFVAFMSDAWNLVAGDTNGLPDVFVHDRQLRTTGRVSVDSVGGQGDGVSFVPSFSADGRFVAFTSGATNLVAGDTNGWYDAFVHDRQTGATERVSLDSAGVQGNGHTVERPAISADGRYVAFVSSATNLVAGDTNGLDDAFVHDRQSGITTRVNVDNQGNQSWSQARQLSISGDGRFVAFSSFASTLVAGDANEEEDVFVRDRLAGVTVRADVTGAGGEALWGGFYGAISAGGRFVSFDSLSANLVPGDTNGMMDIFVRDLDDGDSLGWDADPCPAIRDCDGDGRSDASDNCVTVPNPNQADGDIDGVGSACDNCPTSANAGQEDIDDDTQGDVCDPDDDNDTVADASDNCPTSANAGQEDSDDDGMGDVCDPDDDGDTVPDASDNCPSAENAGQSDGDADAVGDVCDNCPPLPNADQANADGDGLGDVCDSVAGDVNCDFAVNSVDALLVLRFVAGLPLVAPCIDLFADVNCDQSVDSVDALRILRQVAGLPPLPVPPGCQPAGTTAPASGGTIGAPDTQNYWGDVDCDWDIDFPDVLNILRHLLSLSVVQQEPCPDIGTLFPLSGLLFGDLRCFGEVDARSALADAMHIEARPGLWQQEPCPDVGQVVDLETGSVLPQARYATGTTTGRQARSAVSAIAVTVDVLVDAGAQLVGAYQIDVDFDSLVASPTGCVTGQFVHSLCNHLLQPARVGFAGVNASGASGEIAIGQITFEVPPGSDLVLEADAVTLSDPQGFSLVLPIVLVIPEIPTPRPVAHGDVHCDGDVDSVDALKVLRHVAGLTVSQVEPCLDIGTGTPVFGDVDCDGDVDSVDALRILRHVAGLPNNLPAGCPEIGI